MDHGRAEEGKFAKTNWAMALHVRCWTLAIAACASVRRRSASRASSSIARVKACTLPGGTTSPL
jgi:hypothetical protein